MMRRKCRQHLPKKPKQITKPTTTKNPKPNRMLGFVRKGTENKPENIMVLVYPHLGYCVFYWFHHCKMDIAMKLSLESFLYRGD